ncbi:PP2C family protein-serine/threonine phosphatase [Sphingomonas glaciei]|uniref:Protein phosphatase 2C domain-containing protein n=1 Tax=Sphingomonas glaciei TaxID=2938948 RepID=A0ABY5MRP8_9SPHN|nr:protein phosphatase 2C domain-containing protein [Sphingomonas glaciei]UUR07168.1 protein phosphatase 2C domain-containing protein [Sphingomonas glaciei]
MGLKRRINEDALMVRTERGLWAVADGMGGHEAGDVASSKTAQALQQLPIVYDIDELVDAAAAALFKINHELIVLARGEGLPRTIGSTVVGLAIAGPECRCFWAGDSRAYRLRAGKLVQLSRDHSLVQELVSAGMLRPDEALDHPQSNVVTRAVGVTEELRLEIVSGDAQDGDLFLLASDGLTRVVPDDEIADELSGSSLDAVADRLIELVLHRGAPDNVSLILIRKD